MLENKQLSEQAQKRIDEEIDKLSILETGSPEYAVTRNYLDTITDLPWGVHSQDKLDLDQARQVLDRDHDGSVLDNFMDMLGGGGSQPQQQQSRAMNGAGILKHVLGGKQGGAIDMISKMSGLGGDKTGNLMSMLAPMVLGTLGKAKKDQGMGLNDLTSFISGSVQSHQKQGGDEMGIIGKFLDQDGDGSIIDDVAGMGMKILGNFFKK